MRSHHSASFLSGTKVHCAVRMVWGRRCGFVLRNQWEERMFTAAVKEIGQESSPSTANFLLGDLRIFLRNFPP
ncbi:hypothetical protein TNCV_2289291 [Trichonephila clavipes]|uniref:Uncharacterized protein n=1 Tax=Trichonephila clavipes TaxID=2585209 RepID=A0A8X6RNV6_TRICX|nr:hypothetical protein TNCV_2289291 [Trichonephila clavipes]